MSSDEQGLPRLYTAAEIAEWLGKDAERSVLREISSLPHINFRREIRFTREHAMQILAKYERGSIAPSAPAFAGQKTRGGSP